MTHRAVVPEPDMTAHCSQLTSETISPVASLSSGELFSTSHYFNSLATCSMQKILSCAPMVEGGTLISYRRGDKSTAPA